MATSLSGVGMWPRLLLDDARVVESRGADGTPRESHWQTVLPLMSSPSPSPYPNPNTNPNPTTPTLNQVLPLMSAVPVMDPVAPGEVFALDASILLGEAIDEPVRYELELSRVTED